MYFYVKIIVFLQLVYELCYKSQIYKTACYYCLKGKSFESLLFFPFINLTCVLALFL